MWLQYKHSQDMLIKLNEYLDLASSGTKDVADDLDAKMLDLQKLSFGHPMNRTLTNKRLILEKHAKDKKKKTLSLCHRAC